MFSVLTDKNMVADAKVAVLNLSKEAELPAAKCALMYILSSCDPEEKVSR